MGLLAGERKGISHMRGAWAIFSKDFTSFARSWVGVLVAFAFLVIGGLFFTLFTLSYAQLSAEAARTAYEGTEGLSPTGFILGAFLLNLGVLFLFLTPLLAMRSLAEERRIGTLELLYTYPLSDLEIVLGKFLALVAQLFILFLPTLLYAGVIRLLGTGVDLGIILAGSLGFLLLGSAFLAVGLFFSSITENQIIAAGLTFSFLLGFWILEWLVGFLPPDWASWFGGLSPFAHFRDFPLGIVDLKNISYFLGAVLFFLFLTLRVVEARNWKG